jgi:hypothetical protein
MTPNRNVDVLVDCCRDLAATAALLLGVSLMSPVKNRYERTGQLSQVQSLPQLQELWPEQPQLPLLTRVKIVDCIVNDVVWVWGPIEFEDRL